jgi:GGDEF domain-containing protein
MLRICQNLVAHNTENPKPYDISFSYGVVSISKNKGKSVSDLIGIVDETMYAQKRAKKEADAQKEADDAAVNGIVEGENI